jgi:poly-gamma-glutamate capsule biosynthesis protein CapA/YwtB (metallophosphatase superfamily)
VGHHAHIVRGIEFYKGKPVFHGLGNGCVVTHALNPDQSHPARAAGLPALSLQALDGRISV